LTPEVDWKRNLAALWFAELTAIFGFSFAFPFLPLFLKELGVQQPQELALWTGVSGGVAGFSQAIMSPLWGVLADRYGRRSMLARAMIGGALTVGLMGLARGPVDLVILRLLQGATSGTVAAATALVATGTPRNRVGWALGVLSSSIAVGSALGPLVGGLAASVFGLRAIFVGAGVMLAISVVPVLIVVRETPIEKVGTPQGSAVAILRATGAGTLGAVAVLIVCQGLLQISFSGFQPLLVLRLLGHLSSGVASVTGLAFAASGLASAFAAVAYSAFVRRLSYVSVAVAAAVLLALSEVAVALVPDVGVIVLATAAAGLFYGVLGPALASMIGLEAPVQVQARVFGVSASAIAIGFGAGPLMAGGLAAFGSVPIALGVAAGFAVILAAVLALWAREPVH
jgi:DHA1 family multidrug resistance protein-like MFS transporter